MAGQQLNKARFIAESAIILGEPEIGEGTWIGHFTVLDGSHGLKIGKNCSIASGVHIYTHTTHLQTVKVGPKLVGKVEIGDNVAIGANSVIHFGVSIGNNSLIHALSMVNPNTKIPSHEAWGGIPAEQIKPSS